jgi:DNA-binding LacI/PurR family transcriptional regulator
MAESAVDLLLADLRGRRSGGPRGFVERVLEHELVIRKSSSPPGGRWARRRAKRPAESAAG